MADNEINNRMMLYLQEKNITKPAQLGKALGYKSAEKIRLLMNDKTKTWSTDIIIDIAKTFADLNLNWLFRGVEINYKRSGYNEISESLPEYGLQLCKNCSTLTQNLLSAEIECNKLKDELLEFYRHKSKKNAV
jgi:hypothetical protein